MARAKIELVRRHSLQVQYLTEDQLRVIGKFTRENLAAWIPINIWGEPMFEDDDIEDFHAMCGEIDIPWATAAARKRYDSFFKF